MCIRERSEDRELNSRILSRVKKKSQSTKDYVTSGWRRCIELEVDPFQERCLKIHKDKELQELLRKNQQLINFAKPLMKDLYSFVRGTGFAVVLADNNSCILEVIGDEDVTDPFSKELNFIKGAQWTEEYVGNTAINSAIREGKPLQLSGEEHYCIMHKNWTCSSAPIFVNGKIIGVLNVTGYKNKVHEHTLGMVVETAKAIETKFKVEYANNMLEIKNKYQQAIIDCFNDGLLTVDKEGTLTYINNAGAEILGIDRQKAVGHHISDVLDFNPVILNVIKSGKGYIDKEFIITNRSGAKLHFIKSAIPILDEHNNIIGAVDTFRKIERVHKMVHKMVGAYGKFTFDNIIGNSSKIKESIRLAQIAAKSSSNVLIYGESGTGKELFVESIHNASGRNKESFISINCAAIPSELIESELFGYEAGAFTGALKSGRPGKFELANGGTIFLDEIGDMPLHAQAKLLRVLQEKQITRIGGGDVIDIDVRVICATNKDLLIECSKGNFRSDLYYRLNVLNIKIPPLRERKEDISGLVEYFINKMNNKINKNVVDIDKEALNCIIDYDWPGNIRQLENIIERAINICQGSTIRIEDLPEDIRKGSFQDKAQIEYMYDEKELKEIESLEEAEIRIIDKALKITGGNITKAAKALKVSRNTLYNKIRNYKLKFENAQ